MVRGLVIAQSERNAQYKEKTSIPVLKEEIPKKFPRLLFSSM
jgi:hypothetical protein